MSDYPEVTFDVTPTLRGWLSAVSSVAKRSDKTRHMLRHVRVDIGDTVSMFTGEPVSGVTLSATDSYLAVRVFVPMGEHVAVSGSDTGSVLLPVDTLPKLSKRAASSVSVSLPVGDERGDGAGVATWRVEGTTTTTAVVAGAGTFPNIVGCWVVGVGSGPIGLIPTHDRIGFTEPAGVGSAVFGALMSVFATGAPDAPVRVVTLDEHKPARVDVSSQGVEAVGIAMPVRLPGGVFGHMSESVTARSYNGGVVLS
jgi:hypothetical protein